MTNLVNASHPIIEANNHRGFMEYALELAQQSPPASTKFCVGAVLVDTQSGRILSVRYSMELAGQMNGDKGNTHAEQCCFIKVALAHGLSPVHAEDQIGEILRPGTVFYTTMEPCNERLSGNTTCVERILKLKDVIGAVYVGIREPSTFIGRNDGIQRLREAGIAVEMLEDMRDRILKVSTAGH